MFLSWGTLVIDAFGMDGQGLFIWKTVLLTYTHWGYIIKTNEVSEWKIL